MKSSNTLHTLLVCSVSGERLALIGDAELDRINGRIREGQARRRGGGYHATELQAGLWAREAGLVYPIENELPQLLPEDAIEVNV